MAKNKPQEILSNSPVADTAPVTAANTTGIAANPAPAADANPAPAPEAAPTAPAESAPPATPDVVDAQAPAAEPLAKGEVARGPDGALLDPKTGLRLDGPTLEEYVKAGYKAENYPPQGYADKRPAPAPAPVRRNIFGQPIHHDPTKSGIGFGHASGPGEAEARAKAAAAKAPAKPAAPAK